MQFVEEPEREFHIRELAKLFRKSPTTVSGILNKLKKKGILVSRKMSNHVLFRANTASLDYRSLKKRHNLEQVSSSGLIKYLVEKLNDPEAIILFGSYEKGEDIKRSDIDIFVVTPSKKDVELEKYGRLLKHDIQLFINSKDDVDKMKTRNKELLNNLVNGTVIYGFWEAFR